MTTDAQRAERLRAGMFNLPNQLTMLRVLLSVVMFCFIVAGWYWTSFWLFAVAAGTDWVDGYFARKFGQVTALGRILDPFADKVIVCGTLILLVAIPAISEVPWGLRAWMVVVVVGRELLVTTLRSFIEERGGDFSAKWSGKWKMLLQCIAAATCLLWLSYPMHAEPAPDWIRWLLVASVWASLVLTVYSGAVYVRAALRALRG